VALRTYWLNHPSVAEERLVCTDVRTLADGEFRRRTARERIDILIGAPPCQGFSNVGHRSKLSSQGFDPILRRGYSSEDDDRNHLYLEVVRAAAELRPALVLVENVPGMKSARKGALSFLDSAARDLQGLGYVTETWRLNAASHGVPQDRMRFFLVAAHPPCPVPVRPVGAYQDSTARAPDTDALPPVTLDDAIFDLPAREPDEGEAVERWQARPPRTDPRYRRYLAKFGLLDPSPLLFNHTVRYHNERDLELYGLLRPGEDSVHALERHGRDDLMVYRSDVFDDKYARLRGDRPCKTIVSHLAKDGNGFIHPSQARSLSFREAARVQSFGDSFVFCGSPSDQWVQLGNAVPPVLAEAIARSFRRTLERS
jgi:DNA (cytosine-5)-methyltransferase 1